MTLRPSLRAVLFDAGGTLARLDFEWMAACVSGLGHAVGAHDLRVGEVQGRRRFDASERTSVLPYFEGIMAGAGVPEGLWPRVLAAWQERQRATGLWVKPMEGAARALAGVRDLGLRTAVVSNSDGRCEQHLRDCGLRDLLEFVVDSAVVGVEKPDPRIFRKALDRLGVAADEAVYVGDLLSVDAAGARAAGVHFILLEGPVSYAPNGMRRLTDLGRLPERLAEWFVLPGPNS
jgi:putative hydrolase of the HAD superfamily